MEDGRVEDPTGESRRRAAAGTFRQDVRFATRALLRIPGVAMLAIATLALGIGANTAVFTLINGVLLRPLPLPDPERLVRLWEVTDASDRVQVPGPNFLDWRERSRPVMERMAFRRSS